MNGVGYRTARICLFRDGTAHFHGCGQDDDCSATIFSHSTFIWSQERRKKAFSTVTAPPVCSPTVQQLKNLSAGSFFNIKGMVGG